jgi:hypothetical protein
MPRFDQKLFVFIQNWRFWLDLAHYSCSQPPSLCWTFPWLPPDTRLRIGHDLFLHLWQQKEVSRVGPWWPGQGHRARAMPRKLDGISCWRHWRLGYTVQLNIICMRIIYIYIHVIYTYVSYCESTSWIDTWVEIIYSICIYVNTWQILYIIYIICVYIYIYVHTIYIYTANGDTLRVQSVSPST